MTENTKKTDASSENETESASDTSSAKPRQKNATVISDDIIAKIAALATRQVAGVHSLTQPGRLNALREYVPGSNKPTNTQGVEVEVNDSDVAVDLTIIADFGYSLPDLAQAIRKNVKSSIENLTSYTVSDVSVYIMDIDFPEEEKKPDTSDDEESEA